VGRHVDLSPDAEITLEANPGTVDRARLEGFRGAGVNRLSLGVQSFDDRFLHKLGRGHGVAESRAALAATCEAAWENFSLDLIYAVPGQTLDDLRADLAEAAAWQPAHVSAYNLTYEPGTPMQRDLAEGRIQRTPEETEIAMFETVRRMLAEAGLPAYEISNYARPGREARHNQAYWRGRPYLGLGAGAHSFTPSADPAAPSFGVRWQNERDPNRYMARARQAGDATVESETLARGQALGEFCWLGLRETRGISRDAFAARFAEPLASAFPHVADLLAEGLLVEGNGHVALSRRGLLVADSVFATFFTTTEP
jgi:oxygen-independent coproporphyrinogen-3 oxidase